MWALSIIEFDCFVYFCPDFQNRMKLLSLEYFIFNSVVYFLCLWIILWIPIFGHVQCDASFRKYRDISCTGILDPPV